MSTSQAHIKSSTTVKPNQPQVGTPSRLYVEGRFVGYRRNVVYQREQQPLLAIDGVSCKSEVPFYLGKRVAYVYKVNRSKHGRSYKVIWGKIIKAHGNNGLVRAKFRHNLPGQAIGNAVRIQLYPSSI